MCSNAMTYNQSDTIYYKAAKRLLHGGLKMLSPEKLKQLSTSLKWVNEIPSEQLGFQIRTGHPVREIPIAVSPKKTSPPEESTNSSGSKSPKRKVSVNVPEYVRPFSIDSNPIIFKNICYVNLKFWQNNKLHNMWDIFVHNEWSTYCENHNTVFL